MYSMCHYDGNYLCKFDMQNDVVDLHALENLMIFDSENCCVFLRDIS